MSTHINSFLCLGDSYTIGESVPLHEGFPYQTIQLLRAAGMHFHAPEIIAQTGWTSFELADHLINWKLNENYDFVSLLIGVNNQYRGLPITDFAGDFEYLLKKAIRYANNKPKQVIVLSIPDWTLTPFAEKQPKKAAGKEIDAFNELCKMLSLKFQVNFIDITAKTRLANASNGLLAADHLHYSGKMYRQWAEEITKIVSA